MRRRAVKPCRAVRGGAEGETGTRGRVPIAVLRCRRTLARRATEESEASTHVIARRTTIGGVVMAPSRWGGAGVRGGGSGGDGARPARSADSAGRAGP